MTPTHAVKNGVRYRYYVSRPLITKAQTESSTGLRIPARELEQVVTSRVRQWLLDPSSIYQATRLSDPSTQRQLIARAAEVAKIWPELPRPRQRALLAALIDRIDVEANQIDIHVRPTRLRGILDVAATPLPSATQDETEILSIPVRPRRFGREITMVIDGTDPFATMKPDARLVNLLIRARRLNAALLDNDGVAYAALAKREGVSPSYFTRLIRLSYLAPDIIQAILEGRQPRDLTPDKLLAHSRLPLVWNEQRTVLGFACASSASIKPPPHRHCDKLLGHSRFAAGLHDQGLCWACFKQLGPIAAWLSDEEPQLPRTHQRRCGTGIWPDRDISTDSGDLDEPARLCRPHRQLSRAYPRETRGSLPATAASLETRTVRWREMDSNV